MGIGAVGIGGVGMGDLSGWAFLSGVCFAILFSSATRCFSLAKSNKNWKTATMANKHSKKVML